MIYNSDWRQLRGGTVSNIFYAENKFLKRGSGKYARVED